MDFAKMMELFKKYNVEFVSSTEKFDTSTPMGRAMLNICIVFAQLERETIQQRVADSYHSRSRKGFRMGKIPYGYSTEPFVIQGKNAKRLIADPPAADTVRLIYEMYAEPQTSFGDITRHLAKHNILIRGKVICRTNIADILSNPVYTEADMDIYDFFKDKGAEIEGDPADFTGVTGCAIFTKKDVERSRFGMQDKVLVPSPHEGLIPSALWLKVRKKMLANHQYQPARKITQTWMAGKIKCGHCGYSLGSTTSAATKHRYLRCRQRVESMSCVGCSKLKTGDVEQLVYDSMIEKLQGFKGVSGIGNVNNPKLTAAKVELAQVDAEIEKLIESLTGANQALLSFANRKAEELEARKQALVLQIANLSATEIPVNKIAEISAYLEDWENTNFDDKRQVADSVISAIRATSDSVEIEWKI